MEKEAMIEKLRKIVKPYVQNEEAFHALTEDTDFIRDLRINSANLVDVVLDVEDEFDITIDDTSMEQMLTVKAAIKIVSEKLALK